MNFICFSELTDLEKAGIVGAGVLGLILIVLGFLLMVHPGPRWSKLTVWFETKWGKITTLLPFPFACLFVGCLFIAVGGWWLWRTFPENNLSFSQKPWTLGEIKERLESESRVRVDLKGEAATFTIGKKVSGACASDLLDSICKSYPSRLQCERPESGTFVIAVRP